MAVNPDITILLEFYGDMLTEKERETLDFYYNGDLSLREIADNESAQRRLRRAEGYGDPAERETITRQGVRDAIKRAEAKLLHFEEKLGLVRRLSEIEEGLSVITACAAKIDTLNSMTTASRDIAMQADIIIKTANKLSDF